MPDIRQVTDLQRVWDSICKLMVMAAVVTTLMGGPVAALLALFCFAFLGIAFEAFGTFGGSMHGFLGLLAWWGLAFIPALIYSVFFMPWRPDDQ